MEARDYANALRRRWVVVAVAGVVGALIGLLTTSGGGSSGPTQYEATHTLIVDLSDPDGVPPANLAQTELLVTQGEVPERVAERPEFADLSASQLEGAVDATSDPERQALLITVSDEDPDQSEALADAFAEELLVELSTQRDQLVTAENDRVRQDLEDVRARIEELDREIGGAFAEGSEASDTVVAERDALVNQYRLAYEQFAAAAAQPSQSLALRTLDSAEAGQADQGVTAPQSAPGRMVLFGLLGLVLGSAVAMVLDRLDERIQSKERAEEIFGLPVLAEIPTLPRRHRGELMTVTRPESPIVEAYRELRSLVALGRVSANAQNGAQTNGGDPAAPSRERDDSFVVVVSSPGAVEGKTTTVANLAAVFGEVGASVLVIDCDFRKPRLHEVFGGGDSEGLGEALDAGTALQSPARLVQVTDVPGVSVVPSGRRMPNAAELCLVARDYIAAAREMADVVIVDTAPMLVATDATEVMHAADMAVVVVRAGRTTEHDAERASELLERHGAPVHGVVLTASREATTQYSRYYHYRTGGEADREGWRRFLPSRRRARSGPAPKDSGYTWPEPTETEAPTPN